MRVEACIRRLPRRLRGEQLGEVRLGPARLSLLEQPRRLVPHQVGPLDRGVRLSERELDALVLADRAAEDDALGRVGGRLLDEPAPVADALRGDQDPLRVHPVEDVAEALPLLADERVRRHLDAVEEDLGRRVVHQRLDRPDRHRPGRERLLHVDDEGREPLGLVRHLVERRRPREQQHQVGVQRARRPDLLTAD